jgi:hypothetical protein
MNKLEDLLETAPTETAETPEPEEASQPSLAEVLAQDTAETAPEGEAVETPSNAKPTSLKALAETLEMEDKDLYDIEVPMANGESRTLGELKDLVAKQDDLDLRELQFEENRHESESALIKAKQEVQALIADLPENALRPEKLEAFRKKRDLQIAEERRMTLEVIPEWKDENTRLSEIKGIVEHLNGYGFPETYLGAVVDHKTLKYIRENWQREQRIRRALEQVKKGAPSPTRTSKPAKAPRKGGSVEVPQNSRNPLADFLA